MGKTGFAEWLPYNPITELDLSNNTKLIEVSAYNCYDLVSINVQTCVDLELLSAYNNEVSFINLSNNTVLESLHISDCKLTSLDLSANSMLEKVRVDNNQLSDLDLRNGNNNLISEFNAIDNASLTCINVSNVTFAETNFTNIDAGVSFSENCAGVLEDIYLTNETFVSGDNECFGAQNTIVIAGDGNDVIVTNGASINFVAGQSINFLPGTKLQAGCQVNAYITTDGTFCNTLKSETIVANNDAESVNTLTPIGISDDICPNDRVKVFPNPSNGRIMVEMSEAKNSTIYIYNSTGQLVKSKSSVLKNTIVDLTAIEKGLYFVRISNNREVIKRIIIR